MTHLSHLKSDSAPKLHIGSEGTGEQQKPPYNVAFGILSALAILMIVAGHQGYDILTVGGLFPYYSFMCRSLCLFPAIFIGMRRRVSPFPA